MTNTPHQPESLPGAETDRTEQKVEPEVQTRPVTIEKTDLLPGEEPPEEVNRVVDLAEHVASVYGIPYGRAREMMAVGQIFVDGELAHGDQIFFFNEAEIEGKTVEIKSTPQSTKFVYTSDDRSEFRA